MHENTIPFRSRAVTCVTSSAAFAIQETPLRGKQAARRPTRIVSGWDSGSGFVWQLHEAEFAAGPGRGQSDYGEGDGIPVRA